MPTRLRDRAAYLQEIFWRRLSLLPLAFGVASAYDFAAGQAPESWQRVLPHLGDVVDRGWAWWLFLGLLVALGIAVEGGYRAKQSADQATIAALQLPAAPPNRDALVKAIVRFERGIYRLGGHWSGSALRDEVLEAMDPDRRAEFRQRVLSDLEQLREAYAAAREQLEEEMMVAGEPFSREMRQYFTVWSFFAPVSDLDKVPDLDQLRSDTIELLRRIDGGSVHTGQAINS